MTEPAAGERWFAWDTMGGGAGIRTSLPRILTKRHQ